MDLVKAVAEYNQSRRELHDAQMKFNQAKDELARELKDAGVVANDLIESD